MLTLTCLTTMLAASSPRTFLRIPEQERAVLSEVAAEYGLSYDERRLLFVIRLVENGAPGHEMGVLTPAAQRYRGDRAKSLRLQAQWAAGTIQKRYRGDLEAFAARWCPVSDQRDERGLNKNWLRNARYYMTH